MYIVSRFIDPTTGVITGLTPSVKIKDINDSTTAYIVNSVTMDEIGEGLYRYNFTNIEVSKDYYIIVDGGSTLTSQYRWQEQYLVAGPNRGLKILL